MLIIISECVCVCVCVCVFLFMGGGRGDVCLLVFVFKEMYGLKDFALLSSTCIIYILKDWVRLEL